VSNQATWQPGPFFSDGRRVVFLSMEPRRDGPGGPFDVFYTQTPTHIWVHDLERGSLDELCTKDRKRVAFHLAGEGGYRVLKSDIDGGSRITLAAQPGHLYFGTSWSPAGDWVLYVDCLPGRRPRPRLG
jgi:Tol biopolymer transport system component